VDAPSLRFLQEAGLSGGEGVGRDAVDSIIMVVARGLHRYCGGVMAVGLLWDQVSEPALRKGREGRDTRRPLH